jgi:gluconolactonase
MTEMEGVVQLSSGLGFPEGPVVMPDGAVALVEIGAGRLSRVDAGGEYSVIAELGGGPNGAQLGPDGAMYVCNNGAHGRAAPGVQRVDVATGESIYLYTDCDGIPFDTPNDIVFDDTGHFWFTDYFGGALYYAAFDGSSVVRAIDALYNPNGVGLSPDGLVLYWSQTTTRQVHRRHLSAPGVVIPSPGCNTRGVHTSGTIDRDAVVVGLPGTDELDSLAIEANGSICVGTLVDGGITVVTPSGEVEKHTLPAEYADRLVTNIAFGGEDLRTAYITLSQTGRLISCRWPRPGLRLAYQA